MKGIIIMFLLIKVSYEGGAPPPPENFDCEINNPCHAGMLPPLFLPYDGDPTKYVQCTGTDSRCFEKDCAPGTAFAPQLQTCAFNAPVSSTPSPACASDSDCYNGQTCAGVCQCNPWMAEGPRCEFPVVVLIQHMNSGQYLTETASTSAYTSGITLLTVPNAGSYWKEVRLSASDNYVLYQNTNSNRYLTVYSNHLESQRDAYDAQKFYQIELIQFNELGYRVMRLRSKWNKKYAAAFPSGQLKIRNGAWNSGVWYMVRPAE